MAQFTTITSHAVAIPSNDIDTDQIVPARYLKMTDKAGLGAALFADWRYNADGSPKPEFVLNTPDAQGAQILLAPGGLDVLQEPLERLVVRFADLDRRRTRGSSRAAHHRARPGSALACVSSRSASSTS